MSVAKKWRDVQPYKRRDKGWKKQSEPFYRKGGVKGLNEKQRRDAEITWNSIVQTFCPQLKLSIPPETGIGFDEQHAENVMVLTDEGFAFCPSEYWLKNPQLEIRDMPFMEVNKRVKPEIHIMKAVDVEKALVMPHATVAKGLRRLEKFEILVSLQHKRWSLHPTILTTLLIGEELEKTGIT